MTEKELDEAVERVQELLGDLPHGRCMCPGCIRATLAGLRSHESGSEREGLMPHCPRCGTRLKWHPKVPLLYCPTPRTTQPGCRWPGSTWVQRDEEGYQICAECSHRLVFHRENGCIVPSGDSSCPCSER